MPDIREPSFSYPKSAVMFHRYATVVAGNVLIETHASEADFSYFAQQTPAADGDTFTHLFYLAGGAWTLRVMGKQTTQSGMIDWYIDGVKVVSLQDWYGVVNAYNIVKTAAVTIYGNGRHTLKGVVNGKNPASPNFYVGLTLVAIT